MKNVLIVDDNYATQLVLQDTLTEFGYYTKTVANGKEALEQLKRFNSRSDYA